MSVYFMLTPVIVYDVIILLTLTTRPKEEGSNAFYCPPEMRATNDRLLASMNHFDRRTPCMTFKIMITASSL